LNIPSVLGIVGTLLGLVRAVPQLIRLLRAREAFGVSVDTTATSTIVSIAWVVYAILTNQPYVCLSTAPTAVIFGISTFVALRFGRLVREFKIAPVWGAVLLLAGLLGGVAGLGLVLSISVSRITKATLKICLWEPGCYAPVTGWCGQATPCLCTIRQFCFMAYSNLPPAHPLRL